jgi:hypothetical protein
VYGVTPTLASSVYLSLPLGTICDENFAVLQKDLLKHWNKLKATFLEVIFVLYIDAKNLILTGYRKKIVTKKNTSKLLFVMIYTRRRFVPLSNGLITTLSSGIPTGALCCVRLCCIRHF